MTAKKENNIEILKEKLEYFCGYQDRCCKEVEKKMKIMRIEGQDKCNLLKHLIEYGFLDEKRFSENFARGKYRIKKWGRIKIVQELKRRNISQSNINYGLLEIEEEEYVQTLHELAKKQYETLPDKKNIENRKKLFDFLSRKGYEYSLITKVMENIIVV